MIDNETSREITCIREIIVMEIEDYCKRMIIEFK